MLKLTTLEDGKDFYATAQTGKWVNLRFGDRRTICFKVTTKKLNPDPVLFGADGQTPITPFWGGDWDVLGLVSNDPQPIPRSILHGMPWKEISTKSIPNDKRVLLRGDDESWLFIERTSQKTIKNSMGALGSPIRAYGL